ncbi:hypothetical protein SAMN04487931_11715 [Desulfobacula phenolica]|uniref:Uncharacterized protein n=1 Tax=Desulfobacula phenolica TaxID=90732 RepID=A0A1H2JXA1_9BACT|nr:hypothetical protein SAMN04487931_11715 [Desulfobacula phenolica]
MNDTADLLATFVIKKSPAVKQAFFDDCIFIFLFVSNVSI